MEKLHYMISQLIASKAGTLNWCWKLVLDYGDLCNRILHPPQYSVKLQVGVAVSEKGGDIRVKPPRFVVI